MLTHPVMLAYEHTEEHDFPLILIVGREPNRPNKNENSESINCVRSIPFTGKGKNPDGKKFNNNNCAFWNISFGLLAFANGSSTNIIKKDFIDRRACPIIFTDASPIGLPNEKANKFIEREKIGNQKFKEQVEKIFNQKELLKRVQLVIFSGLSHPVYNYFKTEFEDHKKSNGYDFTINKDVPFFFGSNSPLIKEKTKENIQIFEDVYTAFMKIPKLPKE